jgi:hypothetical protein
MTRICTFGTTVLAAMMASTALPVRASASSHREAPLIGEDPAADNTDVYAFVSPDTPDTVTIIAGYIPLEEPGGGPNWQRFSDDVLYEIHIDNTGDARPDITYQFRFRTDYNSVLAAGQNGTFFYNVGQIDGLPTPANFHNALVAQTMNVARVENGNRSVLGTGVWTAPIYVGRFAYGTGGMPAADDRNYAAIAQQAVRTLPSGETVFAGQRDDPFFVDLGAAFDDVTFRGGPFGNLGGGADYVGGYNCHIIAIKVPLARLVKTGTSANPADPGNVVGVYASASRPRVTIRRKSGDALESHGQYVQVSRLGIPLVNEVLIPLAYKDRWNRSDPWDDAGKFGSYILLPSLPTYAQALYGPSGIRARVGYMAPTRNANDPNNDMLQLITGKVGLGVTGGAFAPADLLRLNVRTPGSALPTNVGNPVLPQGRSRLGAAGGDTQGFPNGRRLFDDVVDIELRYVLNTLGNINAIPFGDGVDGNDKVYQATFPYVPIPHPGSEIHPGQHPHRVEPAHM